MSKQTTAGRRLIIPLLIAALPLFYLAGIATVGNPNSWAMMAFYRFFDVGFAGSGPESLAWRERVAAFEASRKAAQIVMLGDSLTAGAEWAEIFADKEIINRGIPGDRSDGLLRRLDEVIGRKPGAVFIMIGVNDLFHEVSEEQVAANQAAVVARLQAASIRPVVQSILFTRRKGDINERIAAANKMVRAQCEGTPGCTYVDLNAEMSAGGQLKEAFSMDGVHLSQRGYEAWQKAIAPLIYQ